MGKTIRTGRGRPRSKKEPAFTKRADGLHAPVAAPDKVMPISWEIAHAEIEAAWFELLEERLKKKEKGVPTLQQVADKTGYSLSAVQRHLANLDLTLVREKTRILLPRVLQNQSVKALKGGKDDVILYMMLNFDWSPSAFRNQGGQQGGGGFNPEGYINQNPDEQRKRIIQLIAKGTGHTTEVVEQLFASLARAGGVGLPARSGGAAQEAAFVEIRPDSVRTG